MKYSSNRMYAANYTMMRSAICPAQLVSARPKPREYLLLYYP